MCCRLIVLPVSINMMLKLLALVSVLVLLPNGSVSYPSGQPGQEEDCRTMKPNHGLNTPENYPRPFDIIVSNDRYTTNDIINVTIRMRGNRKFKGFAVQARRTSPEYNRDEPVGIFQNFHGTKLVCYNYEGNQPLGNGLTHTNESTGSALPKSEISFQWKPVRSHGDIQFRVTVVLSFNEFWVAEPSRTIYDTMAGRLPGTGSTRYPPVATNLPIGGGFNYVPISVNGCGREKSCYRNPASCSSSNCDILVTWRREHNYVDFAMTANTEGWVAVGLSDDMKMGNEDVFECVYLSNISRVQFGYSRNSASGKSNIVQNTPANRFPREYFDGKMDSRRIECYFRVVDTPNQPRSERYHMLMAKGQVDIHGMKKRHVLEPNKYPYVSVNKVGLQDTVDITNTARYALVKVHGCLMLIGWMMCASTALILAKYYKPMWPNNRVCGERVWFAVHRGCMVVNLFATVIGFILIFVHANGYSQMPDLPDKAHPILGIITTILCVLNPLIALCRCNEKSDKRPIFNWIHWFVGTCATVLATPTMFIGLNLPKAHVPWWATWVMVAFMLFHLIIELMLEIHGCLNANKQKYRTQEYEMRRPKDDLEQEPVGKRFKKIILTLYLIVVICLGIVMVISVAAG